ncbi:hypothetical protein [Dyadobacter bucti]|uniref:hypothetical protein n=1 Tax=Dyadobacter bucti TaxID=2572203 RepID=UPI003F721E16
MKTSQNNWSSKVPEVQIDPSLDQFILKNPFPKKLAQAKNELKTAKLPPRQVVVPDTK